MKIKTPLLLTALSAGLLAGQTQAQIATAIATGDDLGGLNLTSYTNPFQTTIAVEGVEYDGNFSSGFDMFHVAKRGTSTFIPNDVADDSLSVFVADTFGIVDENDTEAFFAMGDTNNINTENPPTDGNTGPYDPAIATWVFDISSATSDVSLSIDLAAMGDFEAVNDLISFSVGIDGGTKSMVAMLNVAEDIDNTYTLANGTNTNTLNDPIQLNGVTIDNNFATFDLGSIAGSATASTLELELSGSLNGGGEYVALRNIVISEATTNPLLGDTDGDGDVDDSDLGTSFANYTGPVGAAGNKTAAQGDTDGDGDVDDSDLGSSFAAYTGPQSPSAVPEPTSLALLGLGGLLIARRRRA